jgi:superfamily II DNA/RNA helicase
MSAHQSFYRQFAWLAQDSSFKALGLHDIILLQQLQRFGFQHPSATQAGALPSILSGYDTSVIAETGSGKTFTFALPIAQFASLDSGNHLSAVALPTVELSAQTVQVFQHLAPTASVVDCAAGAKAATAQMLQHRSIRAPHMIAVGTPHTLHRVLQAAPPRPVRWLVLDEADALVAAFKGDLEQLLQLIQQRNHRTPALQPVTSIQGCQTVIAGATLVSHRSAVVSKWLGAHFPCMKHTGTSTVHSLVPGLHLQSIVVDEDRLVEGAAAGAMGGSLPLLVEGAKHVALLKAIRMHGTEAAAVLRADLRDGLVSVTHDASEGTRAAATQTLVFCNSYDAAEAAAAALEDAIPELSVGTLHKRLPAEVRAASAALFESGDLDVLVATDIAARGLDTRLVAHVIQLDCPKDVESHLHRCGRTARGGSHGTVTMIVPSSETGSLAAVTGQLGSPTAFTASHAASQKRQRVARRRKKHNP